MPSAQPTSNSAEEPMLSALLVVISSRVVWLFLAREIPLDWVYNNYN